MLYCLEECAATVWTINVPFGEINAGGGLCYSHPQDELPALRKWTEKIGFPKESSYRTDSLGFIGRFYLDRGLGNRVCQIYCDSGDWDISNYSDDFFDTALIDGGHKKETVITDTEKAFQVLRVGGVMLWHDFCPFVLHEAMSALGVVEAICEMWKWLSSRTSQLFWIYPSWILVGIKASQKGVERKSRDEEESSKASWMVEPFECGEKGHNDKLDRPRSTQKGAISLRRAYTMVKAAFKAK